MNVQDDDTNHILQTPSIPGRFTRNIELAGFLDDCHFDTPSAFNIPSWDAAWAQYFPGMELESSWAHDFSVDAPNISQEFGQPDESEKNATTETVVECASSRDFHALPEPLNPSDIRILEGANSGLSIVDPRILMGDASSVTSASKTPSFAGNDTTLDPSCHINHDQSTHNNLAFDAKPPNRTKPVIRRPPVSKKLTKRQPEDEIPGYQCFPQWVQSPSRSLPAKRRRRTTAGEGKKVRDVKKKGACLRCRLYKLSVSVQDEGSGIKR